MSWKDAAREASLQDFARPQPPAVTDSDLIVMAINRLQRAVVKMQALEYDEQCEEHFVRASEMLGWVAANMWARKESEPDQESEGRES